MDAEKLGQFRRLFHEFLEQFPTSPEGKSHIASYTQSRIVGQSNYRLISEAAANGEDVSDRVLLKLLPYADVPLNRKKGAWINVAPAINAELKTWFENVGWTKPQDWPLIAAAILAFIQHCIDHPEELAAACEAFTALPYSKGFQTGFLTPILNALRPERFLLINNKSRRAINYFSGSSYGQPLVNYPAINEVGWSLLGDLGPDLQAGQIENVLPSDLFDMFTHWLVAIKKYDYGSVGYWKLAPGENARFWDDWRRDKYVSIGWSELGDISGLSRGEFDARRDALLPGHPDWKAGGLEQAWTFAHIQEGDRVIANRGTTEVVGTGTVTGPYYFLPDQEYGHRLPVQWDDLQVRAVSEPGWKRSLVKLDHKQFDEISKSPAKVPPSAKGVFGQEAFALLEGLHKAPTLAFYVAHKDEFEEFLETPFQRLFKKVALALKPATRALLETEKGLFSRIQKNDYGRGGAWDYYWGALFPKGRKRTDSPQLFVLLDHVALSFGFYIGEYGTEDRARFSRRARDNADALASALGDRLAGKAVKFGPREDNGLDIREWLRDPAGEYRAAQAFDRQALASVSEEDVVEEISSTFEALFPLILLASGETAIADILPAEDQAGPELPPKYPLVQLAEETGLDEELLKRWLRAIDRKGQAIIYGPPGTGKTFVAQKLTLHITGGTDGLNELVQFHPAYSYEDFIEGIRPQAQPNGTLIYLNLPGRFLDFCRRPRERQGTCVLVVDEINRANLSRVFGELMYLLEYRDRDISLAGGARFSVPENVRLIGTMNTADRSIALVDHALRRRFAFLALRPSYDVLRNYHASTGFPVDDLIAILRELNAAIEDPDYAVGITYFLDEQLMLDIQDIWQTEIEPYVEEYFYDRRQQTETFRWDKIKNRLLLETKS